MAEILVADDDEGIRGAFRQFLAREGHATTIVGSGQDALEKIGQVHPDLVILDVRMPGMSGLEALEQIRRVEPDAYVIVMTAFGTSQTTIEAMRLGAFDYLTKPLDLDDLRSVIERALEARRLSQAKRLAGAADAEPYAIVNLIGEDPKMQAVYKRIGVLAASDVPVLLLGEGGTGRRLVARTIHYNSLRKSRPFVLVDCAALSPDEQRAALSAISDPTPEPQPDADAAEANRGGTVLLHDVWALAPALQARVAQFLKDPASDQSRAPRPWRVLASTDRELSELVRQGTFHRELWDLLAVIKVELPPLRRRIDDVPELVQHFLRRFSEELQKEVVGVDDRVMETFLRHSWPGNVGELQRVVKRSCVLSRGGVVTTEEVPANLGEDQFPTRAEIDSVLADAVRTSLRERIVDSDAFEGRSRFHEIVELVEGTLAQAAVEATGGNQVKAAELLGLNRTTLRKKLKVER